MLLKIFLLTKALLELQLTRREAKLILAKWTTTNGQKMSVHTFHAKLSEPSATFIPSNCSLTSFFLPANVQKPHSVTTLTKLTGSSVYGKNEEQKTKGIIYRHVISQDKQNNGWQTYYKNLNIQTLYSKKEVVKKAILLISRIKNRNHQGRSDSITKKLAQEQISNVAHQYDKKVQNIHFANTRNEVHRIWNLIH